MKNLCCPEDLSTFKIEVNQLLGRLYSQYYNITFLSLLDDEGNIVDIQIHSPHSTESKKKVDEILKKTIEFKIATSKAAKLLGFDTASETFTKGDSHIIVTYEILNFLLIIFIEMSKPLIDSFDFEKFTEKIELILIELKKKITSLKQSDEGKSVSKNR
jgi:hypothetical protein